MTALMESIRLEDFAPSPVNRARLARYLEVPSVARIDPVTDEEIRKLDARRGELLSCSQRAVAVPIERIEGRWITLRGGASPVEATEAYGCQLVDSGADALVVAAVTVGVRVDEIIRSHLNRDEVYEAFVLKQWAATMTEQARVALTRGVHGWAGRHARAPLPYDGPGYSGWPLTSLSPLLEMLYPSDEPRVARPIRATGSGVLLPTNSMLIVFGVTPRRAPAARHDEPLAQCHRCAMRNCRYRTAATAGVASRAESFEDVQS